MPHCSRVIAHTQVRDPRGPPPPVEDLPWGPHPLAVLKNVEHRSELRRLRVQRNIINLQDCRDELESWFGFGCACFMWCYATSLLVLDLRISLIGLNGFGSLGPNQSCQTTNSEQLCGFVKHVSLWDFDL